MSKSDDNPNNYIALLDPPDVIRRKIKRAVTDSGESIVYDAERPGLANLLTIYSVLSGMDMPSIEAHFASKNYAALKSELGDLMVDVLSPVQDRYHEIMGDKAYLENVLAEGSEAARHRARKTLSKVYRKVGLVAPGKKR